MNLPWSLAGGALPSRPPQVIAPEVALGHQGRLLGDLLAGFGQLGAVLLRGPGLVGGSAGGVGGVGGIVGGLLHLGNYPGRGG